MNEGKWKISLKSIVSVRRQNHLPRLVIHEKYEKFVKWFLRILTAFGIVSSVIAFSIWYISLSFAIVLFLIEQFFEKSIFKYTSIYVQPMPDFKYDPKEWKGMAFAFPQYPDPKLLNVVGCAFATKKYAHKFFKLLKAWNYGEAQDKNNNICLSFIVENENEYSVYLYPNPERKTVGQFFQKAEESQKYEKYGKEHQQLIMQMVFCKIFPYGTNSQLKMFIKKQSLDRPFWLKPFIMKENRQIEMVHNEGPILKYHYKFKSRYELNKSEYEYQHGKNVMKK
ncbi:MAG: hypothetical protein U9N18_07170 [Campylobacterota bacterium]|nr:hypothetical protein [Campylobacterota bacterium]